VWVAKGVTRRKGVSRSTPTAIVSDAGSSCNRGRVMGHKVKNASSIEATDCITASRQKDGADRDIAEAVNVGCGIVNRGLS